MPNNKDLEYSSPFNVNNQIYFCGVPFRLDTYNGCSHGCRYCFVRAAELTSAARKNRGETILTADEGSVKRTLVTALDSSTPRADISIEWLRHRVPIHWGGMSDPFQPCERKFRISKKWMEYLSWYKYPVLISTKGIMLAEPEYLALLKEGNYAVGVSLITDNDNWLKQLEPGAPLASERMRMLETLANNGIWTAVRIQPVIPNTIIEQEMPRFIEKLAKIGVKHVLCEGYKVPVRAEKNTKRIWEICPEAWKEYQYNDVRVEGFELLMPAWRKWKYTKAALEACHANGMTYGAADNDLRDRGDAICCCGCDYIPGFENFWRYQASQAAAIAKQKGFVALEDMQPYAWGTKGFSVHNDLIRLSHKAEFGNIQATPKYAIDYMWNKGGAMSPESIYSMKRATKEGKLVYEWTDPVPVWEGQQIDQPTMF